MKEKNCSSNDVEINQIYFDIIGNLPPEIVQKISLYLSPQELANMWDSCEKWKALLNINYYWMKRCETNKYKNFKDLRTSPLFQKYLKKYQYYWKAVYCYNKLRGNFTNANHERFNVSLELNDFEDIYQFNDEMLVVSTKDQYLRFIKISTGQSRLFSLADHEISTIEQHEGWVLAVSQRRKDVYIFDYESLTLMYKVIFATSNIGFIKCYKNIVGVLGCPDGLFRILNITTQEIQCEHYDVAGMCIDDDMIILGKYSGSIEVFDLEYNNLMNFSYDSCSTLLNLTKSNEYLIAEISRSWEISISVYNLDYKVHLYTIELQEFFWIKMNMDFSGPCIHRNNSFTYPKMSEDFSIGFLTMDFFTRKNLFEINRNELVASIKSNENFIFTVLETLTIKLWCVRTGVFITEISDIPSYDFEVTESKLLFVDVNNRIHLRDFEVDLEN